MHAHTRPRKTTSRKALGAALGALGVAILALIATLVYIQIRPAEPSLAVVPALTPHSASTPAPNAAHRAGQ